MQRCIIPGSQILEISERRSKEECKAFGQREQILGKLMQDYGFSGREFDAGSGLYS